MTGTAAEPAPGGAARAGREQRIEIRDVTLRDGLQNERPLETSDKLLLLQAILDAGVTELELGSFVRQDRVPAMADTEKLVDATSHLGDALVCWGLTLNRRGAERAIAAGLRHLEFVVSASEAHNQENSGCSIESSLSELAEIQSLSSNLTIEAIIATSFGCPFTGPTPPSSVSALVTRVRELGISRVTLADTIGTAVPTEVRSLLGAVAGNDDGLVLGIHLHDTRGLALANAIAALDAGVIRFDGSTGGLGGCPFAPGASGNLALEDLVHALHGMGKETGVDLKSLIAAGQLACELVGKPSASHVAQAGPRFDRTHARA